ncbi:MAG: oligosaccharide flippase family protein [Candidatus Peribacteraceae bacterium]|nr:oligosaccharide flippase family protein [Candidatus Peribacteraceae bacterium]MBP9850379.1 oligosaccharide flippase family protein [Candidatus Peribacteraceae bacterium]
MNPFRYIAGLRKLPFVRDVLTIQAGSMVLMAAGFVSSIAFARLLGVNDYGVYAVIVAFAGTFSAFFNIGQGQSLYVFFSEAYGRKDRHAQAAVLSNFVTVASVNVILLIVLAAIMPMLSEKFYGSPEIGKFARILCFFQISEIWNSMTLIILQSLRRIRLKVFLEQAANLSYLGLAVVALLFGGKIWALLLTQLAVSLVFLPISLITLKIVARKHGLPGIRETLRIPFTESRQYLAQGLIITADKTIANFFPQGLFFIFSLFFPASFVGIAKIAMQLANVPRNILLPQAGDLSTAAFGKMMAEGTQVVRTNAAKLIKHALAFHALLSLGAAIAFPPVIFWFYGPEFWEAIPLTMWLLLILVTQSLSIASSPILRLKRKTYVSIALNLVTWAIVIAAVALLQDILAPNHLFILSFALLQIWPLGLTWYTFKILLKNR